MLLFTAFQALYSLFPAVRQDNDRLDFMDIGVEGHAALYSSTGEENRTTPVRAQM